MAHTKDELKKMIDLDEPEYPIIVSKLTADDIPLLIELSGDANMAVATKAVSCLGMMNTDKAVDGIKIAAVHNNPVMRVAAAHALKNSSALPSAVKLIDTLLDDKDIGVRKFALKTVEHSNIKSLKAKVKIMGDKETTDLMKVLSKDVYKKINL
jgi:HEAT repeat protein